MAEVFGNAAPAVIIALVAVLWTVLAARFGRRYGTAGEWETHDKFLRVHGDTTVWEYEVRRRIAGKQPSWEREYRA